MAIAIHGTPVVQGYASASASGTITTPTAAVAGDLIVLWYVGRIVSTVSPSPVSNQGDSFTAISNVNGDVTYGRMNAWFFWMTSSTQRTITLTLDTGSGGIRSQTAVCVAYSGVYGTNGASSSGNPVVHYMNQGGNVQNGAPYQINNTPTTIPYPGPQSASFAPYLLATSAAMPTASYANEYYVFGYDGYPTTTNAMSGFAYSTSSSGWAAETGTGNMNSLGADIGFGTFAHTEASAGGVPGALSVSYTQTGGAAGRMMGFSLRPSTGGSQTDVTSDAPHMQMVVLNAETLAISQELDVQPPYMSMHMPAFTPPNQTVVLNSTHGPITTHTNAFGVPALAGGVQSFTAPHIDNSPLNAFGTVSVIYSQPITLDSTHGTITAHTNAFGVPTILSGEVSRSITGLDNSLLNAFGTVTVGPFIIIPPGIPAHTNAFGTVTIIGPSGGSQSLTMPGIPTSSNAFGTITVLSGGVSRSIVGLDNSPLNAFGTVSTSLDYILNPGSIPSTNQFGTISILTGAALIKVPGFLNTQAFGPISLSRPGRITSAVNPNGCGYGVTWDDIAATMCDAPTETTSASQKATAIAKAEAVVQALTRHRYGVCTSAVTPCLTCECSTAPNCGCWFYDRIDLDPDGTQPVAEVQAVILEDQTLLVSGVDWIVENRRWLVRVPRGTFWPACVDPYLPSPTITIVFSHGVPPTDDLLLNAVYPLAVEFANECIGSDCALPKDVVSTVQREGVSFAVVNPAALEKGYLTGIRDVDAAAQRDPYYIGNPGSVSSIIDPTDLYEDRFFGVR